MRLNASLETIQKTYETERAGRALASQILFLVEDLQVTMKDEKDGWGEIAKESGKRELLDLLLKDQNAHGDEDSSVASGTRAWVLWGGEAAIEPYLQAVEIVRFRKHFGAWRKDQKSAFRFLLKKVGTEEMFGLDQSRKNLFFNLEEATTALATAYSKWVEKTSKEYLTCIEAAELHLKKLRDSWDSAQKRLLESHQNIVGGNLENHLR